MKHVGVSAAIRKRVAALQKQRSSLRIIGNWPPILDVDEWEAQAVTMQAKLASEA